MRPVTMTEAEAPGAVAAEVRRLDEAGRLLDDVAAAMTAADYPPRDVFAVRLALEEALVNAIKHGHCGDARKRVRVSYRVTAGQVLAEVHDEGPGFDPSGVADPRDPALLDRPSGRGLLLMRAYMTWVRHNARGNGVTLCRLRSAT